MDPQTIKDLANQIALHLPDYSWKLLTLQIILMVLAAGVGAFLGEFFRTKGRHLATKSDFESLSNQLRANTELVAKVNAEVARQDWTQREWVTLRRQKLEEMLRQVHACDTWLEHGAKAAYFLEHFTEPSPHGELVTIGRLYFPELDENLQRLLVKYRQAAKEIESFSKAMMDADPDKRRELTNQYRGDGRAEFAKAMEEIRTAARRVLLQISGLPPD